MAGEVAQHRADAGVLLQHLHRLVTYGPWDLDIASAMSGYGYDAVKWAEGQEIVAELVSCEPPVEADLATAIRWYNEAVRAARCALATQPHLLDRLGVAEAVLEQL